MGPVRRPLQQALLERKRTLRAKGASADVDGLDIETNAKVDEDSRECAISHLGQRSERSEDAADAGSASPEVLEVVYEVLNVAALLDVVAGVEGEEDEEEEAEEGDDGQAMHPAVPKRGRVRW